MKTVEVTIEGITSLLIHKFAADGDDNARPADLQKRDPREEAERAAYRFDDGAMYFPGAAIMRLLREAGANHKTKGSRRSTKYLVPSAVLVPQEAIGLHNGKPITDFEVDSRPVTIPSTKGKIMRHRPRLDAWQATFTLEIDETILSCAFIQQLLEEGGKRIGIGDFRPEKGGPFGRFRITSWKETK